MDCPRCGAPLSSRDTDCRFCGRGRERTHAPAAPAGDGFWIARVGPKKISVIAVLREHLSLGLREAKDLADARTPIRVPFRGDVAKVIAELRNAGADARLLLP